MHWKIGKEVTMVCLDFFFHRKKCFLSAPPPPPPPPIAKNFLKVCMLSTKQHYVFAFAMVLNQAFFKRSSLYLPIPAL